MKNLKTCILFLLLMNAASGLSQSLSLQFSDSGKRIRCKEKVTGVSDSSRLSALLRNCLTTVYSRGYITARVDSFISEEGNVNAYGLLGNRHKWGEISFDSSVPISKREGERITGISGNPINPIRFEKTVIKILSDFQDNGYPFASVRLKEVTIKDNLVSAKVGFNKGREVVIDTLYVKGDVNVNYRTLLAIIGIRKGDLFSESRIERIDFKLRQLPFAGIIKPSDLEFVPGKARIYTYLKGRKASRIMGMAGFNTDEETGRLRLTGDVDLYLINSFHRAEQISFRWVTPGKGIQKLNIETDWPSLFGSQTGIDGEFSLYKKDSTYLNINPKIAFSFRIGSGNLLKLFLDYRGSFTGENAVQTNISESTTLLYGFGFQSNSLNNQILPSSGLKLLISISAGSKSVKGDNVSDKVMEGNLDANYFIPFVNQRFVFNVHSQTKILYHQDEKVYPENELYRIGGIGTIRGFIQETIFSSFYSIATSEFHIRLGENSDVFIFTEKGYVKTHESNGEHDNWPLGLGIGTNLATKAGIISITYAVGQGFGQSSGLKDAKIHIGFSAVF